MSEKKGTVTILPILDQSTHTIKPATLPEHLSSGNPSENGNGQPVLKTEPRKHFQPEETVTVSDGITVFSFGEGDTPSGVQTVFKKPNDESIYQYPFWDRIHLTEFIEKLILLRDSVFPDVDETSTESHNNS
ncbi:hypothetical protein F4X90_08885 [Candidatus Poribacteria bacterium]|nr:hypothetical protein [Candidatus Poribacteria bacterium]